MSYGGKKKKRWIAALVVFIILIGVIGTVAYCQKGNIDALKYVKKYSDDERKKMLEENEQVIVDILEKLPGVKARPLPKEAEEMLEKGEITQEDAILIITGKAEVSDYTNDTAVNEENAENNSAESSGDAGKNQDKVGDKAENKPDGNKSGENKSATEDVSGNGASENQEQSNSAEVSQPQHTEEPEKPSELESLIAEIYILRSSFSGQIDGLVEQAKAEYIANKGQNKAGIAGKYLRKATDLEASCDSQMEDILSRIQAEIKRTGGDSGIVKEIRSAYENEKSIKKADLMAKYNK